MPNRARGELTDPMSDWMTQSLDETFSETSLPIQFNKDRLTDRISVWTEKYITRPIVRSVIRLSIILNDYSLLPLEYNFARIIPARI